MSSSDPVADIKTRLDLAEHIGRRVQLRKSGRDLKGLCPFHQEKTPSFVVHPHDQSWHCFGCNRGGDIFTFIQESEGTDFRGALEQLAAEAGVQLPNRSDPGASRRRQDQLAVNAQAAQFFTYVLWEHAGGEAGRAFLAERGVSRELAERFGLGYAPASRTALFRYLVERKDLAGSALADAGLAYVSEGRPGRDRFSARLMFPVRDSQGRTLGFSGRLVRDGGERDPKYLNTPETEAYHKGEVLFGLDLARESIRSSGQAVLVEGNLDCVTAHQLGLDNVVAMCGSSLTESQARLIRRYAREVVLALDVDQAGEVATLRAIEQASAVGLDCRVLRLPETKDPDEFLRRPGGDRASAWRTLVDLAPREWSWWLHRDLGELDLSSQEGRRTGARRAIALLAKIPQVTTREIYAQEASEALGVSSDNLLREVQLSAPRGVLPSGDVKQGLRLTQTRSGEAESRTMDLLLGVLRHFPELAPEARARLGAQEVGEAGVEVLMALERVATEGESLEKVVSGLSEPARSRYEEASTWPVPAAVGTGRLEAARVVTECVQAIRQEGLERRRSEIRIALREAEVKGDTETATDLLRRYQAATTGDGVAEQD